MSEHLLDEAAVKAVTRHMQSMDVEGHQPLRSGSAVISGDLVSRLLGHRTRLAVGAHVWITHGELSGRFVVVDRELGESPADTLYHLDLDEPQVRPIAISDCQA